MKEKITAALLIGMFLFVAFSGCLLPSDDTGDGEDGASASDIPMPGAEDTGGEAGNEVPELPF